MYLTTSSTIRSLVLCGALFGLTLGLCAATRAQTMQAPFGDKVSEAISNYNRASPFVATSGKYDVAAIAELAALGFRTIIELRGPDEAGVTANAAAAKTAGLNFITIPVTTTLPSDEQVAAFARVVDDPANYPLLASCVSANRAGAMWALYRAQAGVPAAIAVDEGRTVGLASRESAVREHLGLPPRAQ